ncbi:hypothetical protein MPLB_1460016 [Mesorhizobium sp. ORS 3324]|nr:hypothetical protein MPLB_1460016 [Mesorhizobium sp. ORS 3324]
MREPADKPLVEGKSPVNSQTAASNTARLVRFARFEQTWIAAPTLFAQSDTGQNPCELSRRLQTHSHNLSFPTPVYRTSHQTTAARFASVLTLWIA